MLGCSDCRHDNSPSDIYLRGYLKWSVPVWFMTSEKDPARKEEMGGEIWPIGHDRKLGFLGELADS